jgi:hypothetical protein
VEDPEPPPPEGRVHLTGPGPLVLLGVVGLFVGWSIRWQSIRADAATQGVSWLAAATAFFVAAVIGGLAYLTWRTVHREHRRLSPQQGVGRLVLGKATARLAAFGVGTYLGSAISNIGASGEDSGSSIVRALVAMIGAGAALTAALLLERACRVPPQDR